MLFLNELVLLLFYALNKLVILTTSNDYAQLLRIILMFSANEVRISVVVNGKEAEKMGAPK